MRAIYAKLREILDYCDQHEITEFFDGKTLEETLLLGSTMINAAMEMNQIDEIPELLDSVAGANDSCGDTSQRIFSLLLSPEHPMTTMSASAPLNV